MICTIVACDFEGRSPESKAEHLTEQILLAYYCLNIFSLDIIPTNDVLNSWITETFGVQGAEPEAPKEEPAGIQFTGTITAVRNHFGVISDSIFFDLR